MFMGFLVFTVHLKPIFWLPSMSARSSRTGMVFCSCKGRMRCGQRVLNVPAWDLPALGLPTESPQEVVHEVHEVTFMLPQIPKSHHMNQSHQSLPLPDPKAYKASGLIVLPSQSPKPPPSHEVPPLAGAACAPHTRTVALLPGQP